MGGDRARIGALKLVELLDQRREGRVVGDGVEVSPASSSATAPIACSIFEMMAESMRRTSGVPAYRVHACRRQRRQAWGIGDALEVDIVDPRDIVAVGVVVVQKEGAESAPAVLMDWIWRSKPRDSWPGLPRRYGRRSPSGPCDHLPARRRRAWAAGVRCPRPARGRQRRLRLRCRPYAGRCSAWRCVRQPRRAQIQRPGQSRSVAAELHARHAMDKPRAGPAARGAMVGAELAVLHIVVLQRRVAL